MSRSPTRWSRGLLALIALGVSALARATISDIGNATTATTTGSSFSLAIPSSVQPDDALFVLIVTRDRRANPNTVPNGWTLLDDSQNNTSNTNGVRQYLYWRRATSADSGGASTSWSLSRSSTTVASMVGYRADQSGVIATPGDVVVNTGTGFNLSSASVPIPNQGRVVHFFGDADDANGQGLTATAGLNVDSRHQTTSGSGASQIVVSRSISLAGGST